MSSSPQKLGSTQLDAASEAAFRRDVRTFREVRERLLEDHEGEFVLIREGELVGLFPDEATAFETWRERFTNLPVIIKRLERNERVAYISCGPATDAAP